MRTTTKLVLAFGLLLLTAAGCNKDKWVERTGPDDHPKGTTNLSGMDATGAAGNRSQQR